ncbi:MAG: ABC transporter ATP-binding protein [Anaerolineae bacterium]|nr:ABC transporter ATP-binding protein [Anaerolineae bacterium]
MTPTTATYAPGASGASASEAPPAAISLSDVVFTYGGASRALFQGLSLEIPTGTTTAILGPNGSGKTTLLHLILGIVAPTDGVVCLARRPRELYSRRDLGKLIGLVSQNEFIPFNFTVLDYVLLGRAPHLQLLQTPQAEDAALARTVLAEIGLTHLQGRSIQSLSGGERQLAMVARALAQRPRILLLDEPTSHLDLGNKHIVLDIMTRQAAQGVTTVFTTHEPDLAASTASFVVLMREGTVLAAGPTAEILTAPNLTQTYGVPVRVVEVDGRQVILS